ncbi:hypothetical protein EW146_g3742 [Bondarzewia mesenterica]|uniref:Survival protein SurE-like phosphatase/nucleotidase domain-containing protein n=1 Tax=Bondarzewia mesenterica TaxID=1095465 RepID=A0A4S4LYJ1_9AGAM|nr:hypothetical protein EW146_g3742 [Bondarzewia mesenterica]
MLAGKAYQIKDIITGRYYYPRDPDGMGEISESSRPLQDGEFAEWILLDGTPATCANIGLHNLYKDEIDLLLSGPNLGRNTSSAFALSSGTIGAALSSSLSQIRSIALSYGTVIHPTPDSFFHPAHDLSLRIIQHLYDNWGTDPEGLRSGEIDLYNVNIPMVEGLLGEDDLPIYWTRIWRNTYGRLFEAYMQGNAAVLTSAGSAAGPDALSSTFIPVASPASTDVEPKALGSLVFKFAPDMTNLINPAEHMLPEGSDGWAMMKGWVSVTPMRASFAEPVSAHGVHVDGTIQDRVWKMKL